MLVIMSTVITITTLITPFVTPITMAKRVTIMISDELDKKVRNAQARIIKSTNETCSYSKVVNMVLARRIVL